MSEEVAKKLETPSTSNINNNNHGSPQSNVEIDASVLENDYLVALQLQQNELRDYGPQKKCRYLFQSRNGRIFYLFSIM